MLDFQHQATDNACGLGCIMTRDDPVWGCQPMIGCRNFHDLEREKAAPKGTALPTPKGLVFLAI